MTAAVLAPTHSFGRGRAKRDPAPAPAPAPANPVARQKAYSDGSARLLA